MWRAPRPYQGAKFKGGCCQSFPSGEVTLQAAFVTPLTVNYYKQDPWIWALAALSGCSLGLPQYLESTLLCRYQPGRGPAHTRPCRRIVVGAQLQLFI